MTSDDEREANSFRPDRRPFLFGVLANIALAFLFIVLPYTRARLRATEAREAFAEFAACFLGGERSDNPGLALPAGERESFANLVMHGPADWPARCDASLNEIAPDQATFLFPSVKQADADTRAVIELLRQETAVLRGPKRATLDHVPSRPLLALSRLRGALAMLLDAAGDPEAIDRDAVRFKVRSNVIVPTRVPLSAASGAVLSLRSERGVLEAHALDQRGLSWVRVDHGKVDKHRPKRARLLRSLLFAPDPLLVWSLGEARCAGLDGGCVHRAMGVARFDTVGAEMPLAQWLTAHPPGRPDRHVRVIDSLLWVTALDEGAAKRELRVFELEAAKLADAEPSGAARLWNLGEHEIVDSLLLPVAPPQLVTATRTGDSSEFALHTFQPTQGVQAITTLPGASPFALACRVGPLLAPTALWLATFTDAGASVTHVNADNTIATAALDRTLSAPAPFHTDDPAQDPVKLLCDDERVVVLTLDSTNHALRAQTCGNNLSCAATRQLAANVTTFAALLHGDDLVLATAGAADHAQTRVQRFDALLLPLGDAQAPAPCWQPAEGLCGQPTLIQDESRIVLATREQSDLMTIESRDSGATWQPMTGLRVQAAPTPDAAIMNIHRDRKRYAH